LRGLFNPVRLGQVRIAIKSSKIEALGPPINLLGSFGQKFKRTIFKRTTLSRQGFGERGHNPSFVYPDIRFNHKNE
jgi:hypothetical protein